MLAFIRSLPRIVERFVAHLEIPAVVDLLYRVIQCEDNLPAAGVVDVSFVPELSTHRTSLTQSAFCLLFMSTILRSGSPTGT